MYEQIQVQQLKEDEFSEYFIIDTYAWVEFFRGTEAGKKVSELLKREIRLITPTIVIAELSFKYAKEKMNFKDRFNFIRTKSRIYFLDDKIAIIAGMIKEKRKQISGWGIADSIILSTAKLFKAKVITGDEHFRDLKEAIMIR